MSPFETGPAAAALLPAEEMPVGQEIECGSYAVTCGILIRSVEPDGPGRCVVILRGRLTNQRGAPVLELELESLVRSRLAP